MATTNFGNGRLITLIFLGINWEYFDILHDGDYRSPIGEQKEFHVSWFAGTNLNYAEHIFRNFTQERPAIIFKAELGNITEMSWEELESKTASLAATLQNLEDCFLAIGLWPFYLVFLRPQLLCLPRYH
jgi:hypothetical protein